MKSFTIAQSAWLGHPHLVPLHNILYPFDTVFCPGRLMSRDYISWASLGSGFSLDSTDGRRLQETGVQKKQAKVHGPLAPSRSCHWQGVGSVCCLVSHCKSSYFHGSCRFWDLPSCLLRHRLARLPRLLISSFIVSLCPTHAL